MPDDPKRSVLTSRMAHAGPSVRLTRGTLMLVAEGGPPRSIALDRGSITLGSDAGVDFRIEGRGVSRKHAEVAVVDGQFLLRDLGSTNGTFLNGSKIREAYLRSGDSVQIGNCLLKFEPRQEEVRIPPSAAEAFGPLYGKSAGMRQVFGLLERVAASESTLLITGETGTGKDGVARAVHEASGRKAGPFVVFDCSAVSPDLMAAELFGHTEGAFTGAVKKREGAFQSAEAGTIFLDEIGELPLDLQPKLLRVLEAREVRPLGSSKAVPVDVRVLAATHRDLALMVAQGKFREDLFYRLAVVRLELPALRTRTEDLPGLIRAVCARLPGRGAPVEVTPAALARLAQHSWPGNVRELRNVLERSLAVAGGRRLDADDVLITSVGGASGAVVAPGAGGKLDDIEMDAIKRALEQCGGNQSKAAELLGIHRNTLRRKLKGDAGE